MLIYIAMFLFLAFIFSMLLCCMVCMSCLGLTGTVKNWITKFTSATYDQQFEEGRSAPLNSQCCICLQAVQCEVVATCNHSYCARCITDYINSQNGNQIKCPFCRRNILVLMRRFHPSNTAELDLKDKICEYNFKHSEQPGVIRSLTEITSLLRHAPMLLTQDGLRYLMSNPRIKYVLMMIVYTLSPFDILPEAILGPIGLADDSIMLANIVQQFSGLLINFISQEAQRNRARH